MSLIVLIFLSMLFIVVARSRQLMDNKSIAGLIQTFVRAYQYQDNQMLEFCYDKSTEEIKQDAQINFEKKFFLSVDADKVNVRGSEVLLKETGYSYVGVYLDFIMGNGKRLPYYEYYIIQKLKNGSYRVVTENDCPREVMDYFNANSGELKSGSLFQLYEDSEKNYVKLAPEYADTIYQRLLTVFDGMPDEMEDNLRFLSIIFLIAIVQLWLLYTWAYLVAGKKKKYTKQYLKNKIKGRKITK